MSVDTNDFDFETDVDATIRTTMPEDLFLNIQKGGSERVRFLPKKGSLWVRTVQHRHFKDEDRTINLACLKVHGTNETGNDCFIERLIEYIKKYGNKKQIDELATGAALKGSESIAQYYSYYSQVWKYEGETDGKLIYTGPRLLRLPKTGADLVGEILDKLVNVQEMPPFNSRDKGQDIIIKNSGVGPPIKWYSAVETAKFNNLDDIAPGWKESFIHDIYAKLNLRIRTPYEQYEIAKESLRKKLDWEKVEEIVGIPEESVGETKSKENDIPF